MSKFEDKVAKALSDAGYHYVREVSYAGLVGTSSRRLRFDFKVYSPHRRFLCLLEVQGKQHYFPVSKFGGERGLRRQQHNDMKKRKYCLEKGIRLVTIPYYDEDKISAEYMRQLIGGERWLQ